MSENLDNVVSVDSDPQPEVADNQNESVVEENLEVADEAVTEDQNTEEIEDSPILENEESVELTPEKVGALISAERKRTRAQHTQEITQLQQEVEQLKRGNAYGVNAMQPSLNPAYQQELSDGTIQDPLTGQFYMLDSPKGAVIARELEVQGMQQQNLANKERSNQQKLDEDFQENLSQGHLKYDNFTSHLKVVASQVTPAIEEALVKSDAPAALVNFLGKNPGELNKITALPIHKQAREIYRLEDRLTGNRKLTTSAPKPVSGVNSTRNTGVAVENQTIDQRAAENRLRYFGGRRYG